MEPPTEWPSPPPPTAAELEQLRARQAQQQQIAGAMGVPASFVTDPPYGLERRGGFDPGRAGMDFTGYVLFGPGGVAEIQRVMRITTEGFEQFIAAIARASLKVWELDRKFEMFWWYTLTPAQQRRHGKRLIREEIARRRLEKVA